MVVSVLNLAPIFTPMASEQKLFVFNRSTKLAHSFQVRCDGSSRSRAPDTVKVARREIAFGLTAVCTTLATVNAEARVLKPELRNKILEKLGMPREKVSPPPPGPPPGPPPSLLGKEKNPTPLEPPPLPLDPVPTLSESVNVVETAIPLE